MFALRRERFQMHAQALRIAIERGFGIDLGQTIAHKVGRNHPTRQRLGNGPTTHVVEEQVVRLRATAVVLVQDIAQGHLNRIGKLKLLPVRVSVHRRRRILSITLWSRIEKKKFKKSKKLKE